MKRAMLGLLLAVGVLLGGSGGAQASCGALPGASLRDELATAPVVFVGTVAFTSDNDRVARVRVESIWRGPDLPAYVDVLGSPVTGPFTASSVDRKFRSGERYVFVPSG